MSTHRCKARSQGQRIPAGRQANYGWVPHLKELSIVAVAYCIVYSAYMGAKYWLYADFVSTALANAMRVIEFEQRTGLFWEPAWQKWALATTLPLAGQGSLAVFFNWAYILAFGPFMVAVSLIVYAVNRRAYRHYRNVLLVSFGLALVVFIAFPLAPPRMIPVHFIDTIAALGPSGYGTRDMESFYNAYAAMPSMHFGWAVMFGVFFLRCRNPAVKALGLFYPALMLSAIVMTANHYVIDAVAGGLVIFAAFLIVESDLPQRLLSLPPLLARRLSHAAHRARRLRHHLAGYLHTDCIANRARKIQRVILQ